MAETIAKKYLESLPRPKGWRQRRKWPWVLAAAVGAAVPILIIFIFLQKYMIAGLTAGAVKE